MGGGQSTPAMMSYSVALSKMDHHGQARVKRRFKEMSEGSSPPTVGREAFCNALAPYCSNEALARAIFRACVPGGGKRKNAALDLQDFVAAFGHAVLGSFTQKAGFAFAVFDRHHSGQLSRGDLSHTLELLCSVASESHILLAYPPQTELAPDDDQYAAAVAEMAERAFPPQTQALDFEKFIGWISGNRQLTSFIALVVKAIVYADIEPAGLLESYKVASPPLMLNGTSEILDDRMSSRLRTWLPTPYCKHNMFQLFSSEKAGFTLMGLLHQHGKRPDGVREKASVLLLEDYDGHVFGVYTAFNWTSNSYDKFFGTEESFLFSLKPEACLYDYDGSDNNVMIADEDGIGFGGKRGFNAIFLESNFSGCTSKPSMTFGNPQLAGRESFNVKAMELYGFIDQEDTDTCLGITDDDDAETRKKKKAGVLQSHKKDTFVLEHLSGRSHGYSNKLGADEPDPE